MSWKTKKRLKWLRSSERIYLRLSMTTTADCCRSWHIASQRVYEAVYSSRQSAAGEDDMRCPAGRGACLDLHDVTTRHACNRKIQLDWCRRPHNMQTNDLHTNCHWHVQTMQWCSQGQNVKEKAWTFKAEATTISPKAFMHMAREEIKIQPDRIGSKLNFDCFYLDIHLLILITYTGWPLSRQCEIPWHFPDSSRHSAC